MRELQLLKQLTRQMIVTHAHYDVQAWVKNCNVTPAACSFELCVMGSHCTFTKGQQGRGHNPARMHPVGSFDNSNNSLIAYKFVHLVHQTSAAT